MTPPPSAAATRADAAAVIDTIPEEAETSPTSGLPNEYYEKYSRTYNLQERQQQAQQQQQQYRTSRQGRSAGMPDHAPRGYNAGGNYAAGGGGGSSVAGSNSDHLSAAVDNLFRMVEKKVVDQTPRQAPPQQPPTPQPNPLSPPRDRSSWTSTAIHSEVSRLYHLGAAGTSTPPPPELPASAIQIGSDRGRRRSWVKGTGNRSRSRGLSKEEGRSRSRSRAPPVAGERTTMILFFLGFLLFPCWFVGALSSIPSKWRLGCRITSVVFLMAALALAIYFIFFFKKQ
ncbi:hypothetical protein HDU96_008448 [Phlyctochytrium bullatum]|nr:hypothetical protein HDU96_008448 [Phlyctochytrium bullatum]